MSTPSRTPAARRREISGWVGALFVVVVLGLSWVPYASQQATVEAALSREQARHAVLVQQVALRVEAQGRQVLGSVQRIADFLARFDHDDPRTRDELKAMWDMLHAAEGVEAMVVIDTSGHNWIALGGFPAGAPEEGAFAASLAGPAGGRPGAGATIWSVGPSGLHMTIDAPILGPDGPAGRVAMSVDLAALIGSIFRSDTLVGDVSFTVLSSGGDVLLHAGLLPGKAPAAARMGPGCAACHDDPRFRAFPVAARPGTGREVIQGVERVLAFAPVAIADQVWFIWASTPVTEVVRPVAQQTIVALFFTLSLIVILLVLGLLVRRGHIRQIRLENALEAKERHLKLVEERERLRREVEASRRMASIGEMVARVAHEVKNPLQYIGTAADLLGTLVKDPDARELVGDMRTGVRTLNAIVTDLNDFARPMRLEPVPVDVGAMVREVVARVVPADVETRLDLPAELPEIRVDGYKLRQVLENLVRNAVEALPEGPAAVRRLELSTAALADGPRAGGIRVVVRDTGKGIPAAELPRVFEPFFTTKTHGSGLGLAVVQRIVDAHGGRVVVDTPPGGGARFTVDLPPAPIPVIPTT